MISIANSRTVQELAQQIGERVPSLSMEYDQPTVSGKKDYTFAVGRFWNQYRAQQEERTGKQWTLYPDRTGSGRSRGGEYLVDFMLFEQDYGARVACESEWGMKSGDVEWDFDKLCGVKADIKVLIYECSDSHLMENLKKNCLEGNALLTPDEAFLFVHFDGGQANAHWWKPEVRGPFKAKDIHFMPLP